VNFQRRFDIENLILHQNCDIHHSIDVGLITLLSDIVCRGQGPATAHVGGG
jgi:hypothetical protein